MKNLIRVLLLLAGSQSFLLVPGRWSRRVHTSYSRNKPIHSVKVLQSDIALNEEDEEGRGNGNGGGIDSNGNDNDSDRTYEEMYLDRQVADLLESPMELRSETLNELFRPPPGLGRLAEVIKPDRYERRMGSIPGRALASGRNLLCAICCVQFLLAGKLKLTPTSSLSPFLLDPFLLAPLCPCSAHMGLYLGLKAP